MRIAVTSGNIELGAHYEVVGGAIDYDTSTYNDGDEFIGTDETDFTVNSGSPEVFEYSKITGASVELVERYDDIPVFPDETEITGVSVEIEEQRGRIIPLIENYYSTNN